MTGHDLDLAREIREAAETWLYDGDADQPLPGHERLYDLADEVESLRAKLTAAEQERDAAREKWMTALDMNARCRERADRAEAALAAVRAVCAEVNNVREYGERGSTFQAGANQLARRIVRALAAAEQDESKQRSYHGTGLLARIGRQEPGHARCVCGRDWEAHSYPFLKGYRGCAEGYRPAPPDQPKREQS